MAAQGEAVGAGPMEASEGVSSMLPAERPRALDGRTYKIKPPLLRASLYVTITHVQTATGELRPVEIFVFSQNREHFEWITALCRMVSAVLRQPGDFTFILDELEQVWDPKWSYWTDGQQMPSVVANIAKLLREHVEYLKGVG